MVERMRSRISAAAFSVNVTATILDGSAPPSSNPRYVSTSLRVLPVPALAQMTVFFSSAMVKPPSGTGAGSRMFDSLAGPQDPVAAFPFEPFAPAHQCGHVVHRKRRYRWHAQLPEYLANAEADNGLPPAWIHQRGLRGQPATRKPVFEMNLSAASLSHLW